MTVVVADTSPLNYLVLIEAIDLLPRLYRRVLIPQEVFQELREPGAPPPVGAWIDEPPEWLEVRRAPMVVDPALDALDPGERAAILLAHSRSPTCSCEWTMPQADWWHRNEVSQTLGLSACCARELSTNLSTFLRPSSVSRTRTSGSPSPWLTSFWKKTPVVSGVDPKGRIVGKPRNCRLLQLLPSAVRGSVVCQR